MCRNQLCSENIDRCFTTSPRLYPSVSPTGFIQSVYIGYFPLGNLWCYFTLFPSSASYSLLFYNKIPRSSIFNHTLIDINIPYEAHLETARRHWHQPLATKRTSWGCPRVPGAAQRPLVLLKSSLADQGQGDMFCSIVLSRVFLSSTYFMYQLDLSS